MATDFESWHIPRVDPDALSRSLLEAPPQLEPDVPRRRWAYGAVGLFIASLFIAYHSAVLLVWNTPSGGLGKRFHSSILRSLYGHRYFTATNNTQSWSMFAPNPNRTNVFIRVLVEDKEGKTWDMGHDIWEVDRFPYFFYDRMGKVNRRIDGKKGYQKSYGGWMCRYWALTHDGELPEAVQFVKRWTKIPRPHEIKPGKAHPAKDDPSDWGYDPWKLNSRQKEQERIVCAKEVNAQLPNEQRARHELALLDDDGFKPVRVRTWWDRKVAEERREEAKARAAERAEQLTQAGEGSKRIDDRRMPPSQSAKPRG